MGSALAECLRKEHTVFGAVRSEASLFKLREKDIVAFQNPDQASRFWDIDTLIISISPRHNYLETLEQIALLYKNRSRQVILLSSTSVYGDLNTAVDEESPTLSESVAAQGELLFKKHYRNGVIVRLGGLMGNDRIAGQWGASRVQDGPVNYIHQDDAVGIIKQIIEQEIQGEVINAVAPLHPRRSAIYKSNCERFGFRLPDFVNGKEKTVLSEKSGVLLGYHYRYEDPRHFWPDNLDKAH